MARFLPNEILLQIVRFVDLSDTRTLANLRLASQTTREFSTPRLFSAVKLHAGLEASLKQMDSLSANPMLAMCIQEIIITDISMIPVDTRDMCHLDAIPSNHPDDKELEVISRRVNGLCLALKENAAAEASKIQIDGAAAWCIKFLRSFWRLLDICVYSVRRLRLWQDRVHILATDQCEDLPLLMLFNTFERFDFPALEEVDMQCFYIRNLKRLSVHINDIPVLDVGGEQFFWSLWENVRCNMRRIKKLEFSSIRNYDVSPPELQDGDAGYVRREVFQYMNGLEEIALNGRTSIAIFNLLHKTPSLTKLSLHRCSRISGCDLVDVLKSLENLTSLEMEYIQLHKPDKPAEYFSADFTLEKQIDSRLSPFFVVFKTLATLTSLSSLKIHGLNYCKDEMNPWRTFVSHYNGNSPSSVLLRSPYMTDHDDMRALYGVVRERRWELNLGTAEREYSYFWTKEVTGYDPDKGVGFAYWDEIKGKEMLKRCFEDLKGPPPSLLNGSVLSSDADDGEEGGENKSGGEEDKGVL